MIKNIVFDLGNVLISFKPAEFFEKKNYSEKVRERILTDIFRSEEWLRLDNGELSTTEVIESIASRSSLKKEEIAFIFNLRTELMYPIDQNVKILPELKKRGFRLYFLSNFPLDIFDEIKSGYYFFKYFDGGLISAEAKVSKPESRIYEILMEKYSLAPEECLFIDDIEINVKAAEAIGMQGLVTFGALGISQKVEAALANTSL
jgi:epoxide hydrolase-like predicted phosphatase